MMEGAIIKMIVTLVSGTVLALLDLWLRHREVKDPTLRWLYLGLFSWTVVAAAGTSTGTTVLKALFAPHLDNLKNGDIAQYAIYLLSPVSSLLFTIAAFQLSRVREMLPGRQRELFRNSALAAVLSLSLISVVLLIADGNINLARYFDAGASVIAIGLLGAGVAYSFLRYDNLPLLGAAIITFGAILWRQIDSVFYGPPLKGGRLLLSVASNVSLGILLVVLATAWGLSRASRLTIVGRPHMTPVVAFFCDLRGSTKWAEETRSNIQISEFMNALREWIYSQIGEDASDRPNAVKYLGDGYMIIWEKELRPNILYQYVDFAAAIAEGYGKWRGQLIASGNYFANLPKSIGVGLDFGSSALRLTHENGTYDYIGRSVNYAAKFQALAKPSGGVVISEKVWNQLDEERQARFTKETAMTIDKTETVGVRHFLPDETLEDAKTLE